MGASRPAPRFRAGALARRRGGELAGRRWRPPAWRMLACRGGGGGIGARYSSSPAFCAAANAAHRVGSRWLGVARDGSGGCTTPGRS
eukprot:536504-Prymnesium_polylepis.1